MIQINELIREGVTKRIYATSDPDKAVVFFKDEAMAYHGLKRGRILGKGEVNNQVCKTFFGLLSEHHIPNHYLLYRAIIQVLYKRDAMMTFHQSYVL